MEKRKKVVDHRGGLLLCLISLAEVGWQILIHFLKRKKGVDVD